MQRNVLPKTFVFDLDGTLIDSKLGIIQSIDYAFDANNLAYDPNLNTAIIGLPLPKILQYLSPDSNETQLQSLARSFKLHYDSVGFQQCNPFPGVNPMLAFLASYGVDMHIVTNKRINSAHQVINFLGWFNYFKSISSPDSFDPVLSCKTSTLRRFLVDSKLKSDSCIYIGDLLGDYNSAKLNKIPFAWAKWGFEDNNTIFPADAIHLESPYDVREFVIQS